MVVCATVQRHFMTLGMILFEENKKDTVCTIQSWLQ